MGCWKSLGAHAITLILASACGLWGAVHQQPSAGLEGVPKPPSRWTPPAQGVDTRAGFVGSKTCAECHTPLAASQATTEMAHGGMRPEESDILHRYPRLTFTLGPYSYLIESRQGRVLYSVSDGRQTITEPVLLALGLGVVGQTYLIEHGGALYESTVSFFKAIQGLDITIGHSSSVPTSLEDALGRRLDPSEARRCLSCHNTASLIDYRLDLKNLVPGVHCEACHGPGAWHVAAMKAGKFEKPYIFNPAMLAPDETADFCGACHRSFLEVVNEHVTGVRTVRFQPFRLVESRCWNPDDPRMRCTFCHDPHKPLVRETAAYDNKCLACHRLSGAAKAQPDQQGKACPAGKKDCAGCHMPRIELPGAHYKFADHRIRVVRPGEPYPD